MKIKIYLAILVGLLILSAPAMAQQKPSTSQPPPPAIKIEPDKLAAAKELGKLLASDRSMSMPTPMDSIDRRITFLIIRDNPNQNAAIEKLVADASVKVAMKPVDNPQNNGAYIYANFFSIDELQDVLKFYKSPAGQKVLQYMPQIMQQVMMMRQEETQQASKEIAKNVIAALKDKNLNVPKELEAMWTMP